ncbi:HD-GYP domain-containing protein [Candidatus Nitronereus thalassa]|uniref:DUF3391 domain-containing protein n=1 Tax=Candidatus Nitronereus thalassa TaxID=3020898 RepID=A0ABU3KCR2_9BACT|nr:HD domain-containing phosphohydrolase [Candidatus Nitronereus thalassa]MDT7044227.1 DUF3391 domain-containing protein [Candidatus Nitronereus thalassa]
MKRRISIEQLKPGMHLVGLDKSWLQSPLWIHRGQIKSQADIVKLRQSGVREVTIDIQQGADVENSYGNLNTGEVLGEGENLPVGGALKLPQESQAGGDSLGAARNTFTLTAFEDELRVAQEVRTEAISAIKRVFEGIKTGVVLESGPLREVTQTIFDCLKVREGALLADAQLQRMRQFDATLFSHSVDVCVLALVVGYRSQMSALQLHDLALGALLHDVGQLRLPRNLLLKKGTFTSEERNLYLNHPKLGSTLMSKAEDVSEVSRRIVLEHHERVNGKGYPWKRQGNTISLLAQLVGLVDRYDALVSKRGNRPPLPPALAVRRLYQLGLEGEFSMEWVEALVQSLGLYPVGSLVELTTGERGWVVSVNQADHMLPMVKLVWNKGRKKLDSPYLVELSEYKTGSKPVRVERILNPFEEGLQDDLCFVSEMQHATS